MDSQSRRSPSRRFPPATEQAAHHLLPEGPGWRNPWQQFRQWIDPQSLQVQLTITIASFIAIGMSSVALWTTWKVQQIMIDSHKQDVVGISEQILNDIMLYEEMMPRQDSIQKALDNRASRKLLLWVQQPNGKLVAASPEILDYTWKRIQPPASLATLFQNAVPPKIFKVQDRDFVACNSPLKISNQSLGELYIAQDITEDQQRFEAVVRMQLASTAIGITLMAIAVALYLRRSLRPLHEICQTTHTLSAEDLGQTTLIIPQAPTEIQQLTDTFNRMLARLSKAWVQQQNYSDRQREFVSNVSHELRTPLTVVRGYLQSTLRRGKNLTEAQCEALAIAANEAEHTIQVLQDLLDLARADDGHIPFRMEHLILNDIAQKVIETVQRVKDHPITLEAATDLISVYADETRLQQVLVNLIENAINHSEATDEVVVRLDQTEEYSIVRVIDQGIGIAPEHKDRVFDRFYRVDEARTRVGGTGLGLSIVKTFVEGMGGEVSLESEVGEGSTFTVSLPTMPMTK